MRVPEWVAHSAYSKAELAIHMSFAVPRFARVPLEGAPPLQLQCVSRYKQTPGTCRGVVPDELMLAIHSVLEGLFEAE